MPYKHEYNHEQLPIHLNRRIKLTTEDKEQILHLATNTPISQKQLAEMYGVSRKTIYNILNPEKYQQQLKINIANKHHKKYYNKEYNTKKMRDTRQHKQKYKDELIKKN